MKKKFIELTKEESLAIFGGEEQKPTPPTPPPTPTAPADKTRVQHPINPYEHK